MTAALALAAAAPAVREITIRRTLDAAPLNEVANHPEVRPWLDGEGPIDLNDTISNLANIALAVEGGGFFLQQLTPGEYEVHSIFLPSARSQTVEAMRQGMLYLFTRTNCTRIVTKVPDGNRAASGLALKGGLTELFRRGGAQYLGIDIDHWAMNAPELEAEGEWFHGKLEEAKRSAGSELPTHDHDPAHERAVGAAVLMMRAGQAVKAVAFYNRWAIFARYQPIQMLTESPVVLDVGDALIELRDGDMEILKCR